MPDSKWVKLLKDYEGHKAGEQIQVDTEESAKALVTLKTAELCDDPTPDILGEAIDKATTSIVNKTTEVIDLKLKEFSTTFSDKMTSKMVLPAQVKEDPEDELKKIFPNGIGDMLHHVKASAGGTWTEAMQMYAAYAKSHYGIALSKAAQGVNTLVDSEGGFLVLPEMSNRFIERMYRDNQIVSRTLNLTTGSNSLKINGVDEVSRATGSRWGGVRSYWIQEAEQFTKSSPKFRQVQLNLHKLGVFLYCTEEQLDDTGFDLEAWFNRVAQSELDFMTADSIINGTGAGMPQGILNSPAKITVSKEVGQAADTITWNNIIAMYSRMWPDSISSAVWLVNSDTFPALATMSMAIGTGGVPVYLPANGAAGAPYGTLFGRPVIPTEFNPTLGDEGDIIFADLSQYATLTKRGQGVKQAMSIHLRFDYEEVAYRWSFRVDGRSLWHSALTPFKGTLTKSPFVTLEARA